jgi:hypothetical protein
MLLLGACGFQPLHSRAYEASQPVNLSMLQIEVSGTEAQLDVTRGDTGVPRRYSELLKAEISESPRVLPTGQATSFKLSISFTEQQAAQFVNPDGTASRGTLNYVSRYEITRLGDKKAIARGDLTRMSSYNTAPNADYTSYISLEDARKRGILELAQAYKLRLAQLMPVLANPDAAEMLQKTDDVALPALQPAPSYETLRSRN